MIALAPSNPAHPIQQAAQIGARAGAMSMRHHHMTDGELAFCVVLIVAMLALCVWLCFES